jgi:acylaminoacyl-peptidase
MYVKRKFRIEDFCALRTISSPELSPDGSSIVFSVTYPLCFENRYTTQIYIMALDGKPSQLTIEGSNNLNPIWSPSGTYIVFISNLGGEPGLWKISPEGGIPEKLGGVGENLTSPLLSPFFDRILFLSWVPQGEPHHSDVQVIRRLPYKIDDLGFLGNKWRHLFLVDAERGEANQVTEGEYNVSAASWSPDGRKIAYLANKSENAPFTRKNDIWVTDLKVVDHEKLTDGSRSFRSLSYSPDGKWLASIGNTERYGLATKNDIYALNLESEEELNLTAEFDSKIGDSVIGGTGVAVDISPVWTPDSKAVYFLTAMRGNGNLYKVSLDSEVELASDALSTIQSYSFSKDQRVMAFLATDMVSPSEIWVKEGDHTRRLTGFNDGLLGRVQLSKGEKFTFKASDGVPVDGWFYMSVESVEGKGPMVLIVKGGPHMSCYGNAFSFPAQVLAANGFSVLYTNERGSGGYGEKFAKTARARFYGEREFRDIMEAVDYVIYNYPVDGDRLGITGYSRGGFLTNWTITHTDRFKAAVAAGSFCDNYSLFGTGWENHIWCEKNFEGTPWDDEELYLSKSPLRYVKNATTPTMIIHALQDKRASVTQAEQLYVSLKRLGKEVELVLFPGEEHSLPRKSTPKHMMEYHQHILRWFNRFL